MAILTAALIVVVVAASSCAVKRAALSGGDSALSGSGTAQGGFARLSDMATGKLDIRQMDVGGSVLEMEKTTNLFWVLSSENLDKKPVVRVTRTSVGGGKTAAFTIDESCSAVYASDSVIVVKLDAGGFEARDKKGGVLWKTALSKDFYTNVFLPDKDGGLIVFGRDTVSDKHPCLVYTISGAGKLSAPQSFSKGCPSTGLADGSGGFWIMGSAADDSGYVAHMRDDRTIDKCGALRANHYPTLFHDEETGGLILPKQCYVNGAEKGFIEEMDAGLKETYYQTFTIVPSDVIKLSGGRRAVAFFDRKDSMKDRIGVYDSHWKEKASFDVPYGFTKLFADGEGLLVVGGRLAPGQDISVLSMSSIQPRMDTVLEKYDANFQLTARKTIKYNESRSVFLLSGGKEAVIGE